MAAAIPVNDVDCQKVFRQHLIPCTNVYCPEDWVLRDGFRTTYSIPLGLVGYKIPAFHRQYRKTDSSMHDAEKYILCLKEHLGKPSDPPLSLRSDIKVKYPCTPTHTNWGLSAGTSIEKYHGWILHKRLLDKKYDIISPFGLVMAEGTEKEMRESFEDIKRQLNEKKK